MTCRSSPSASSAQGIPAPIGGRPASQWTRSDTEDLTALLAQLVTLNPTEFTRMTSAGLAPVRVSDLVEVLAALLDPRQLGALHGPWLRL